MKKKWIWISLLVLSIAALAATVIGFNSWFNSGNVRVMGGRVRVSMSGTGYIFDHETGEMLGTTLMSIDGQSRKDEKELFDGWMNILNYVNEYDGVLTTIMGTMEGDDGYWEIVVSESCKHLEENDQGSLETVHHSCKYSYTFYVHPDKQDFLVARVKDSYAIYPYYVVMADSQEEATRIYKEFVTGKY